MVGAWIIRQAEKACQVWALIRLSASFFDLSLLPPKQFICKFQNDAASFSPRVGLL